MQQLPRHTAAVVNRGPAQQARTCSPSAVLRPASPPNVFRAAAGESGFMNPGKWIATAQVWGICTVRDSPGSPAPAAAALAAASPFMLAAAVAADNAAA